jgi:hypothetical protein
VLPIQARAGHQLEDRQGAWPRRSTLLTRADEVIEHCPTVNKAGCFGDDSLLTQLLRCSTGEWRCACL